MPATWTATVMASAANDLSTIGQDDLGLFVTLGTYTRDAQNI